MKTWAIAIAFFFVIAFTVPVIASILGHIGLFVLCLISAHFVAISLEEA